MVEPRLACGWDVSVTGPGAGHVQSDGIALPLRKRAPRYRQRGCRARHPAHRSAGGSPESGPLPGDSGDAHNADDRRVPILALGRRSPPVACNASSVAMGKPRRMSALAITTRAATPINAIPVPSAAIPPPTSAVIIPAEASSAGGPIRGSSAHARERSGVGRGLRTACASAIRIWVRRRRRSCGGLRRTLRRAWSRTREDRTPARRGRFAEHQDWQRLRAGRARRSRRGLRPRRRRDRETVALVEVIEGLDLPGLRAEQIGRGTGLVHRSPRLGQLDLLNALHCDQKRDPASVNCCRHSCCLLSVENCVLVYPLSLRERALVATGRVRRGRRPDRPSNLGGGWRP